MFTNRRQKEKDVDRSMWVERGEGDGVDDVIDEWGQRKEGMGHHDREVEAEF